MVCPGQVGYPFDKVHCLAGTFDIHIVSQVQRHVAVSCEEDPKILDAIRRLEFNIIYVHFNVSAFFWLPPMSLFGGQPESILPKIVSYCLNLCLKNMYMVLVGSP